jgi:U3 small nucleolar RNA-associated protein 4
MTTALSSYVLIIDLAGDKPRVLRRFDQHRMQDTIVRDRVTAGRTTSTKVNGHAAVNGNGDVEMEDVESPSSAPEKVVDEVEAADESEDDSDDDGVSSTPAVVSIDRIAISSDGQWAATSDNRARTHVFNLDLISVRPLSLLLSLSTISITFRAASLCPPLLSPSSTSSRI